MKKLLTSCLAISSIILFPALKADVSDVGSEGTVVYQDEVEQEEIGLDTPENIDENDALATDGLAEDPSNDTGGTPVGSAANEGTNAAKKRHWQNIALAAGAVAVAVTALILVANNNGHHSHHKGK